MKVIGYHHISENLVQSEVKRLLHSSGIIYRLDDEKYKNQVIYAEREILGELPDGVYYIADLIGLDIVTEDGEKIGTVSDVFNTGSNDIYEVKREGKKNLLLPVIDDVVLNIDVEGGKITVRMMDGLEDLA